MVSLSMLLSAQKKIARVSPAIHSNLLKSFEPHVVPHSLKVKQRLRTRVVYRDVMTASRRHDTTGRDGPLCHDTIGSA